MCSGYEGEVALVRNRFKCALSPLGNLSLNVFTFKAPITTAADDLHKYFFHCFSEKIWLDVSSESSARFT